VSDWSRGNHQSGSIDKETRSSLGDGSARGHMISSLFLIPFGTNVGYAIESLENLFYRAGVELAQGDESRVHFAYSGFKKGPPKSLPPSFSNLVELDYSSGQPREKQKETIRLAAEYVEKHHIRFVMFLDIQPVHPIFRPLHKAGARTIMSYWGAPMSSLMPAWKLALKKVEVAMAQSRLDGLIFESRAMARTATHGRGVPQEMIDVVPLGIDVSLFGPQQSDYVYDVMRLPRDRRVVVYSGHMERRKGVHVLIESAKDLLLRRKRKDVCFLLCGNTGDQSLEYEQMYGGLGIDGFIKFAGYRSDMARIYPSCFCGVIPSSGWDSFPRTSLEMAASALPVIGSRLGGLPESILEHETGLLFEPGEAGELADRIETLLENPKLAKEYGQRGRERCVGELNLKNQFDRLLAAFRRHIH